MFTFRVNGLKDLLFDVFGDATLKPVSVATDLSPQFRMLDSLSRGIIKVSTAIKYFGKSDTFASPSRLKIVEKYAKDCYPVRAACSLYRIKHDFCISVREAT